MRRDSRWMLPLLLAGATACTTFEDEQSADAGADTTTPPTDGSSDGDVTEGPRLPVFGTTTGAYAAPEACTDTTLTFPLQFSACGAPLDPPAWQLPGGGGGGMQDIKASCGTAGAANAEPRFVHLSFPETDASTTIGVTWVTGLDTLLSDVQFGTSETELTYWARGFTFTYDELRTSDRRAHEARLCGLQPSTTYYYRVGGEGAWSDIYSFTTAPAPNSTDTFRLAVTGDSRSDEQALWRQALEGIETQGADLLVFTGDAVETGTVQDQWDVFYTQGEPDETFDRFASLPWVFTHGNHDYVGDASWALNAQPRNEQNFWVRYGNTVFISLDDTGWFLTGELLDFGARDFLVEALEANADATWRIVSHHRPIYSSGTRHGQSLTLLEAWSPVFDQYGVDLVLNGHEHNYERSLPIRDNAVATDGNGTVYMVAAGVGAPMYDVGRNFWTAESLKTPTFVILDISPTAMNGTTYDLEGTVVDTFTIEAN